MLGQAAPSPTRHRGEDGWVLVVGDEEANQEEGERERERELLLLLLVRRREGEREKEREVEEPARPPGRVIGCITMKATGVPSLSLLFSSFLSPF